MKTALYLGTDPSYYVSESKIIHYPIIQIIPKELSDPKLHQVLLQLVDYTHIILTSKNAVLVFFKLVRLVHQDLTFLKKLNFFCIGDVTAHHLALEGFSPSVIAQIQTQEGLIKELGAFDLNRAFILYPRSSISRNVLAEYFISNGIKHTLCDLYDTIPATREPDFDFSEVDEIIFTSPSTVEAFFLKFGFIPLDKKLITVGPITAEALKRRL